MLPFIRSSLSAARRRALGTAGLGSSAPKLPGLGLLAVVTAAVALPAPPLSAIIRRHDVPDYKYEEYGRRYRDGVVSLALPDRNGAPRLHNGMGVLVGPQWVLTAAHAAEHIRPGTPLNPYDRYSVYVRGVPRLIDKVVLNPGWKKKGAGEDIALVRLKEAVCEVVPVGLYEADDELGKLLTVAGYGIPGDGLTGPGKPDAVFRAAQVKVDEVSPQVVGWTFRAPKDGALKLEGISGPGDSGGPALIERKGRLFVVGVSSTQRRDGRPEGTYGVKEYYARVSHFKGWIEEVMRQSGTSDASCTQAIGR